MYFSDREENEAAREKKAISKANRTSAKLMKIRPGTDGVTRLTKRKRVSRPDRQRSGSSATPEPIAYEAAPVYRLTSNYSLPSIERASTASDSEADGDDGHLGFVNTSSTHFEYHSSSKSSLHSEYESDLMQTDISFPPTPTYPTYEDTLYFSPTALAPSHPYESSAEYPQQLSRAPHPPALIRSQSTPYFEPTIHHARPQGQGVQEQGLPYPSYSSQQPNGLCLYIPGNSSPTMSTFSPSTSYVSHQSSPALASLPNGRLRSPTFPLGSPPVYQGGPIDWTSRPLAPFSSILTNNSGSGPAPMFSDSRAGFQSIQTVRLDQVCSSSH